jgi:hypothetical protein
MWIAIAATGFFLVGLAIQFSDVVDLIYRNSDYSSTPVIAELFGDRGSEGVTLGNYLWIEPLYALLATKWLPGHRHVWDLLPFVTYAFAVLVFAWTLRRTVSPRAGLLGALALACPAPLVLGLLGAPANRLPTMTHALILSGFLVVLPSLAARPGWIRGLWAVALAVTLAPGVSSDQLMIVWGVVPFLAAVTVGWRTAMIGGRVAAIAVAACLAGVAGGLGLVAYAEAHGFSKANFPIEWAAPEHLAANGKALLESIAQLVHGQLEVPGAFGHLLGAIAIAAMVGAPVLFLLVLRNLLVVLADDERPAAQRLLFAFWVAALAGIVLAVLATDVAHGITAVRYLLIAWPALLALAMIVYRRRALPVVATVAASVAVLACVQLLRNDYTATGATLKDKEIAGLERFVADNRLDHGYAGYWDAAPITYLSDYRVRAYPVMVCGQLGRGFCPFFLHTIGSWYVPRRNVRTFLIDDRRDIPDSLRRPPLRWGEPFARARVGRLRVYAYAYDLAFVLPEGSTPGPVQIRRNARAARSSSPGPRPSGGSSSPPHAAAPHS